MTDPIFDFALRLRISPQLIHTRRTGKVIRAWVDIPSKVPGIEGYFRHTIVIDRDGNFKTKVRRVK